MSAEIVEFSFYTVAERLRQIADEIEAGEHFGESATLILDCKIMGLGTNDCNPFGCLWDLKAAEHKIMASAVDNYKYGKQ